MEKPPTMEEFFDEEHFKPEKSTSNKLDLKKKVLLGGLGIATGLVIWSALNPCSTLRPAECRLLGTWEHEYTENFSSPKVARWEIEGDSRCAYNSSAGRIISCTWKYIESPRSDDSEIDIIMVYLDDPPSLEDTVRVRLDWNEKQRHFDLSVNKSSIFIPGEYKRSRH